MDTRFEQTGAAIALKADATTVGALEQRVEAAEQKVTPQAITSAHFRKRWENRFR